MTGVLEVQVDADTVPRGSFSIELTVGRWTYVILCQQLHLSISDAGILELHTGHKGLAHLPAGTFITLKVGIRDRAESSSEECTRADKLNPPLGGASSEILGITVDNVSAASVYP